MNTVERPPAPGDVPDGAAAVDWGPALRRALVSVAVLAAVVWLAMSWALQRLLDATHLSNRPGEAGSFTLPAMVVAAGVGGVIWGAGRWAARRWDVRAGLGTGLGIGVVVLGLLAAVTVHNVGEIRAGRTPLSVREQAGLLNVDVFTARIDWIRDELPDGVYVVHREPGSPWLQVVAIPPTHVPDSPWQDMGISIVQVRSMTILGSAA